MGLANDGIEASASERPLVRAISRRPILLIASAFGGLGMLAIVLSSQARDGTTPKLEEEVLLVPDRASAEHMRTTAKKVEEPAPVSEQDNLGVHRNVADVPADALGGPATFIDQQRSQYEHYLLQVQQEALDSRRKARAASLRVRNFFASSRGGASADADKELQGGGDLDALSQLGALSSLAQAGAAPALSALSGGGMGGSLDQLELGGGGGGLPLGMPFGQSRPTDPNFTASKKDFFKNGGQQLEPGRLNASLRPAWSPYEVQMGTVIPGIMISGINSEAPGQIIGQVSEHVYDSATGKYLLIPQGTRLVGTYSATIAHGQARVQVAWVRANFPNGSKLDLGGMSGADQGGTSGFTDKVDRHFLARLGAALLSTSLTVAYEVVAPMSGNYYQSAVHRGVGEGIVQLGKDIAQQEGQRPPTLVIRPGYRFVIHVNKDVVFQGPYEDGIQRRGRR